MKNKVKLLENILYIIQGAIVGAGAILPGVSGGVLCVVFGIYEPMMDLLTHPKRNFKTHLPLFLPFGIGWVIGFFGISGMLGGFLETHPEIATMLLFGLVCGTIPDLFKKSELSNPKSSWTPLVMSLSIFYVVLHIIDVIQGGAPVSVDENFLSFLFCGVMWGISLIVPGFSSSPILMYLGLFEPLTSGIGMNENFNLGVVIPFGIGVIVTVLLFARLVDMLFKQHYALASRIIIGFVISSSLKTLPDHFKNTSTMVVSIVCFVLGFAATILLEKIDIKIESKKMEG